MGIIIHDDIETNFGIDVENAYCSFGASQIQINRIKDETYEITTTAYIWYNHLARKSKKMRMSSINLSIMINSHEMNSIPLYEILYTNLKPKFNQITNMI